MVVIQVVIALVVAAIAGLVALVITRRTRPDVQAPTSYEVPAWLDRSDFARPDAPWLVAVFSSSTCLSCQDVWEKARHLESDDVAVEEIEAIERKDLHQRYDIDAVPMVVVVDADGATRSSFLGVPSAADLWAAVAELRNTNSRQ